MEKMIENPMGLDGIQFIELTAREQESLHSPLNKLGFHFLGNDQEDLALYHQGDVHFIVNQNPTRFAKHFSDTHGPSICGVGFRVKDAENAYRRALMLGCQPAISTLSQKAALPAIIGVGGSLIYFVDEKKQSLLFEYFNFQKTIALLSPISTIDHLAINVHRGRLAQTIEFFKRIFNFEELKSFDIQGQYTGFKSHAMMSPCGKIRLPINESADDKSQIEEFLIKYNGEGIQHVALTVHDICDAVTQLKQNGVKFMDVPNSYYDMIDARLPGHNQDINKLKNGKILIDGETSGSNDLLLQIFTDMMIGPIFFELIQRKGNQGFGGGNIKALFESMERDQIERGFIAA